jgi:hypothetical protein
MLDPVSEAPIRAQRYWYRDGLSEMVVGVVSLLQGGWILFNHLVSSRSSWYGPGAVLCLVLLAASAMFVPRITAAIRERVTYPRSGYVSSRLSGWKRHVVLMGLVLLSLAMVGGALVALQYSDRTSGSDPDRWIQWLPAVGGVVVGALSVFVWIRQSLPRFLAVGIFSFTLGVVVSNEYRLKLAMAIWLAGNGCAWLCSGGVALWNYVRTTPPSADAT